MSQRKYDSTVARIAGNILSGMDRKQPVSSSTHAQIVKWAVATARAIVAEVERTEPAAFMLKCGHGVEDECDCVVADV